jgi:hypothetical protein
MGERLRCSACGKPAACGCNARYVTKVEYAALHMNPKKTDRANGKEMGVSKDTVRRAGKQLAQKAPTGKREGQDGKMYSAKKKSGTGRPIGRPRTDAYYSMKTANRLRGKARSDFMEEWAVRNQEKALDQHPDLKWQNSLGQALGAIVSLDADHEKHGVTELLECNQRLATRVVEILNRWLIVLRPNKPKETADVVRH